MAQRGRCGVCRGGLDVAFLDAAFTYVRPRRLVNAGAQRRSWGTGGSGQSAAPRRQLAGAERIRLLDLPDLDPERSFDYDRSKLLLFAGPGTGGGKTLYQRLLSEYGLQLEMMTSEYVLAMTSVCDDEEGFYRLRDAVIRLDEEAKKTAPAPERSDDDKTAGAVRTQLPQPARILPIWEAVRKDKEKLQLREAAGRIAAEYINLYPPGVPLLVPGEQISEEALRQIFHWEKAGMDVAGTYRHENGEIMISVLRQEG